MTRELRTQQPRPQQRMADNVPTSDALRHSTDFARAGDKVPFPDPATAPLGTDDEAAGRPPSREERRLAAAQQQPSPRTAAAAREKPDHTGESWAGPLMIAAAVLCGLAIVAAYWFAR
jgi:hypothetical protein